MPDPRERIYDLALRALDEQERQVGDLRSRLAPVVAAGGIGVTLLTRPAFQGGHPSGWLEITATAVGLIGAAGVVLATAYLLGSRPLAFSVDALGTDRRRGTRPRRRRPPIRRVHGTRPP